MWYGHTVDFQNKLHALMEFKKFIHSTVKQI